jgi:DNA topoisomerase II
MNTSNDANTDLFFDVQQKTDKQHILDNPDTYIGSVESIDSNMWIMSEDSDKIVEKNINYIPGLFKLFDEGIVNCRDHVVRMKTKVDANVENALPVSHIDVCIEEDGSITMINDGNGIDVAQKDGLWIPELVFGHLRTSTNYNKEEKKIVGGKNGFGFKLVLIWSTYGRIETVDHIRGLKYIQEYKNNLDEICKPSVSKCKNKPYTKITFKPDYSRLGITGLTPDIIALLKKRVYDISAVTDKTIKVKYNNELVPVKCFEQYISMYIGDKSLAPRVYEDSGAEGRWEYAVALTPTSEFVQVSFVNGIHTSKGGKHVEYILNQIVRKLVEYIEKKKKTKVNPNSIKEQLILFLRCDIENPAFDSQTKDYMNTPSAKFGSKCEVSDKFIEKVAKMGVMDAALQLTEVKENKAAKKTDGTKCKSVRGIPKLTDANFAGTENSSSCMLILCEGDSAKAGILSGLSSEDRNIVGVYPLKGKLLNVRGEPIKKIADNKEIAEIKQILGLVTGKKYLSSEDVNKNLRYGKVLFMTDQDLDGSHIKGLCINLFACEWPTLTQIPGFIGFMNTPILKAKKGSSELNFYNDGEFEEWKEQNDIKGWNIKYYKGLGTSTGKEFKEYFENKKVVEFEFSGNPSEDAIDMVFNKKRADDRKDWLKVYDRDAYLDTSKKMIPYEEFINRELIHFSKYDCDRSIPNLMDGLKISQRKIMFSAFKRNLTTEIKVAQFSGYVSEHSGYHHGEASLNAAIVGMAQNFVGSNNINLLLPNGQFGTRLQGGKDSASERYIFTLLNKITRTIFPREDGPILEYLNDDGLSVEPVYYAPIIPMILVNGSKGIGTGFSTDIMCYNPLQIIEYIKNKLRYIEDDIDFLPYYEGFKGDITKISDGKFLVRGKYEKVGQDKIRVTELPVGYWTEDFKELLEYWCNPGEDKDKNKIQPVIKDYQELWTDSNVLCEITFVKGKLDELENAKGEHGCNGLEKLLKLYTTNTTTNMHLFDSNDTLQKYEKVTDIIDAYYDVRLKLYQDRKDYMIERLERELVLLSNKAKYIQENLDDTIDLRKKKKEQVVNMLETKGYDIIDGDEDYSYLVKMPMDSVTEENVERLNKEHGSKVHELESIKSTTINQMWLNELDNLSDEYLAYKEERTKLMSSEDTKTKKKVVSKASAKKVVKKQTLVVEDD